MNMKKEAFLNIIDSTPLVSVDLIIENAAGEILLGKRNNKPAQNYWFVPGGRILKNETIAAAIKRVSFAELGLELSKKDGVLLGAFDHIYTDNFAAVENINTHYVALGFKFKLIDDVQLNFDNQHESLQWLKVDGLMSSDNVHANTKLYFE